MTVCVLAFDKDTMNVNGVVPLFPSGWLTLLMEMSGGRSSLRIVPVASPSTMTALLAFESVTSKVSSGSSVVSPARLTTTVLTVSPLLNVSDPEAPM